MVKMKIVVTIVAKCLMIIIYTSTPIMIETKIVVTNVTNSRKAFALI